MVSTSRVEAAPVSCVDKPLIKSTYANCIQQISRQPARAPDWSTQEEAGDTIMLVQGPSTIAISTLAALTTLGGVLHASAAHAAPYGDNAEERLYLAQADQYLPRPRPTDVVILEVGQQICQVRRSGGSTNDAKVAAWNTWNTFGVGTTSNAVIGSLVHLAIDNMCPEVGYP
jgi:hypothetical protein